LTTERSTTVSDEQKIETETHEDEDSDVEAHLHDLGAVEGNVDPGAVEGHHELGANEPRANDLRPSDL
jgi:hypothetical protein